MRSLFIIFISVLVFLWLVSKCGSSTSDGLPDEYARSDAERKQSDSLEAVATRERLLAEEERKKQEAIEEKRFLKSKAGRIYKKHPEWSKEDCQRIADNEIWIGMSIDMLKYKHGLPNHANPSNYGNGTQWQWCWDDLTPSCYYDNDNDGKIDSYN